MQRKTKEGAEEEERASQHIISSRDLFPLPPRAQGAKRKDDYYQRRCAADFRVELMNLLMRQDCQMGSRRLLCLHPIVSHRSSSQPAICQYSHEMPHRSILSVLPWMPESVEFLYVRYHSIKCVLACFALPSPLYLSLWLFFSSPLRLHLPSNLLQRPFRWSENYL